MMMMLIMVMMIRLLRLLLPVVVVATAAAAVVVVEVGGGGSGGVGVVVVGGQGGRGGVIIILLLLLLIMIIITAIGTNRVMIAVPVYQALPFICFRPHHSSVWGLTDLNVILNDQGTVCLFVCLFVCFCTSIQYVVAFDMSCQMSLYIHFDQIYSDIWHFMPDGTIYLIEV